jgi:hypothetical protein
MSRSKRRIAIIKDVIAQLKTQSTPDIISNNSYVSTESEVLDFFDLLGSLGHGEEKAGQYLDIITGSCEVCALGSIFLGKINQSKTTVNDMYSMLYSDGIHDRDIIIGELEDIFGKRQLNMIECAFELHDISEELNEESVQKCLEFGNKHFKTKNRLLAILKNMLKNKGGLFTP